MRLPVTMIVNRLSCIARGILANVELLDVDSGLTHADGR